MIYTAEERLRLIAEQAASGLSVAEFSRQRGLSAKAMYSWQSKVEGRESKPEPKQFSRVQSGHKITIELLSGLKLTVSLESLKAVIRELESR